jgi:hypothetical protein
VVVVRSADLLVCRPAFSCGLGRGLRAGGRGSGGEWWPGGGAEHVVPEGGPLVGPGPVRGPVQHRAALRAGEPGGDGDELAAQGGAAGDGVPITGEGAGGA